MKKVYAIALLATILAAVSVGGCAALLDRVPLKGPSPSPDPIHGPVPSPSPTPKPSPSPPLIITPETSYAVKLITSPVEYKVMTWEKDLVGQFENFTFIVANDGAQPAKNVVLKISIKDSQKGVNIHYQEFNVGDLARGERKPVNLITDHHDMANMITVSVKIAWGEFGEYNNNDAYTHVFSIPW